MCLMPFIENDITKDLIWNSFPIRIENIDTPTPRLLVKLKAYTS